MWPLLHREVTSWYHRVSLSVLTLAPCLSHPQNVPGPLMNPRLHSHRFSLVAEPWGLVLWALYSLPLVTATNAWVLGEPGSKRWPSSGDILSLKEAEVTRCHSCYWRWSEADYNSIGKRNHHWGSWNRDCQYWGTVWQSWERWEAVTDGTVMMATMCGTKR